MGQVSTTKDNGDGTYSATYTAGNKAGTATVTAKTANGQTASLQLSLTARPAQEANFKVTALKTEKSAKASKASYFFTVVGQGGWSDTISFFASQTPIGVQASFSPEKVELSVEETTQGIELELSLPAQIEAKDYDFTVLATSSSGGQTKILPLRLKVEAEEGVLVEKVEIAATATDLLADGQSSTQSTTNLKGAANQAVSGQTVTLTVDRGQVSAVTDNGDGTLYSWQ